MTPPWIPGGGAADNPVTAAEVLAFVQAQFEEGDEASDRLRSRRFGWEVDTQPRAFLVSRDSAQMLLGNGPILIDRHSGDYWFTSSSPWDVFGDGADRLGWPQLTTRAKFERWCEENDLPNWNIHDGAWQPDQAD